MKDRASLQVGGIAAVIGGVGTIVVNALHPRPPARTDELLTLVASMPHWTIMHYGAAFAVALIVAGVALLVQTLQDTRARALGEAGKYVIALGAATFMVAIMVDGYGFPYFAERWMAASANEKSTILWAAEAVHTIDNALFPVWSGMFMGVGVLFIAVALWQSAEYSRTIVGLGMIGATMCLIFGVSRVLGFEASFLWPTGPAIESVWVTVLGAMMLRKAGLTSGGSAVLTSPPRSDATSSSFK